MVAKKLIMEAMLECGYTFTKLVEDYNNIYHDTPTTLQSLSNKLSRGSIQCREVNDILNVLGYELKIEKINTQPITYPKYETEVVFEKTYPINNIENKPLILNEMETSLHAIALEAVQKALVDFNKKCDELSLDKFIASDTIIDKNK